MYSLEKYVMVDTSAFFEVFYQSFKFGNKMSLSQQPFQKLLGCLCVMEV